MRGYGPRHTSVWERIPEGVGDRVSRGATTPSPPRLRLMRRSGRDGLEAPVTWATRRDVLGGTRDDGECAVRSRSSGGPSPTLFGRRHFSPAAALCVRNVT